VSFLCASLVAKALERDALHKCTCSTARPRTGKHLQKSLTSKAVSSE
jgi:hypothetical protein